MFKPNRHFLVKGSFCKPFDVSSLCSALYLYFVKVLHSMETSSNLPLPLFPLFLLLHLHRHFSDLLLLENQSINEISNIGKSPHQKSHHYNFSKCPHIGNIKTANKSIDCKSITLFLLFSTILFSFIMRRRLRAELQASSSGMFSGTCP